MSTESYSIEFVVQEVHQRLNDAQLYYGHGTDNAQDEAVWLIAGALDLSPQASLPERALNNAQYGLVLDMLKQRIATRKPLAYLLNSAWFCGLEFYVDERVIVPRSPIAELILQRFEPWLTQAPTHILDLCTGSGCIAIACALTYPEAYVDASDVSEGALAVAAHNVESYHLESQVSLHKADVFTGLTNRTYDLIVTNPPYVDSEDMASLPAEYCQEPNIALAAGSDGLLIVKQIIAQAQNYLSENGILICEVGNSQQALIQMYPELPFIWLQFENGGEGVFLLHAKDIK